MIELVIIRNVLIHVSENVVKMLDAESIIIVQFVIVTKDILAMHSPDAILSHVRNVYAFEIEENSFDTFRLQ